VPTSTHAPTTRHPSPTPTEAPVPQSLPGYIIAIIVLAVTIPAACILAVVILLTLHYRGVITVPATVARVLTLNNSDTLPRANYNRMV
jgi:hypothetical protein